MREHPIPPVTDFFQYRAIGLVRGKYIPEDFDGFSRGLIIDGNGVEIETVVLGKTLGLIKRRIPLDTSHLWVVYPRCRDSENLHLQIAGIWEPSILGASNIAENSEKNNNKELQTIPDQLKEGDDYFSIRGELIYTKPETNDVVLKIRQKQKKNGRKNFPFKLNLHGEISMDWLRNFVSLDVRRTGQKLYIEDSKLIGLIKNKKSN